MLAVNLNDERRLFMQIAEGNETAFSQIFNAYKRKLFAFTYRMVKQESVAEELVQEIFMKLWSNRFMLEKVENPNTYIFIIARNKTIDHLRKIANERKLVNELWQSISESRKLTDEIMEANESQRLIDEALATLSPQKQTIFRLSRYQGLTHNEIAEELNLSKSTVKNNMVEILKFLKTFLQNRNEAFLLFSLLIACFDQS